MTRSPSQTAMNHQLLAPCTWGSTLARSLQDFFDGPTTNDFNDGRYSWNWSLIWSQILPHKT